MLQRGIRCPSRGRERSRARAFALICVLLAVLLHLADARALRVRGPQRPANVAGASGAGSAGARRATAYNSYEKIQVSSAGSAIVNGLYEKVNSSVYTGNQTVGSLMWRKIKPAGGFTDLCIFNQDGRWWIGDVRNSTDRYYATGGNMKLCAPVACAAPVP